MRRRNAKKATPGSTSNPVWRFCGRRSGPALLCVLRARIPEKPWHSGRCVQPPQPSAQNQLKLLIFAGEQVDKCWLFHCPAGFLILWNDRVAKIREHLVLVRGKIFRNGWPGDADFSLWTTAHSAAFAGITCRTDPLATPTASVLKMSRRVTGAFAYCFSPASAGGRFRAPTNCLSSLRPADIQTRARPAPNRQSRILVGIGYQRRSIHHENIFHVVRLESSTEDFEFRAHARCTDFVNDFPAFRDPKGLSPLTSSCFAFAARR